MSCNYRTISYIYFKFGVHIMTHTENIFISKMTLNSHFYKTYNDLNLQKCLFHTSQQFTFFILVHYETPFKVTLKSTFYKPYNHINLLNCVFYPPSRTLKNGPLTATISYHPYQILQHIYIIEAFHNMQFHSKVAKILVVATVFLFEV